MREIIANRVKVRNFAATDANDLYEYLSLPSTYIFESGEPVSLQEARRLAEERSGADLFLAVELRETGKMIGHLSLFPANPPDFRTFELGYIFNPAFHNKGFATEAATALLWHLFTNLGAHRVMAHCSPDNPASWKVLEKLGLRREGLEKKNIYFRKDAGGKPLWLDSCQYAILEEEFLKG
jgi:RimJ/RimL family protein N-acetyltransferase